MNIQANRKQLKPGQIWVIQSRPAGTDEMWIEDVRGLDPVQMEAAVSVWANPLREYRRVARKIRRARRAKIDRQGKMQFDFVTYNG